MTAPGPSLIVTRDAGLLDDLRRLAMAAGVEPQAAASVAEASRSWGSAACVLVGADVAQEVADAGLRRRADVTVVSRGEAVPWPAAVRLGADSVLELPASERTVLARLVSAGRDAGVAARVVGVVGGVGGAGATVLAVALGVSAARLGNDVLLVDGDPGSGGLDVVLAAEEAPGARWSDLDRLSGTIAPDSLRSALPTAHGVAVLATDCSSPEIVSNDALGAVLDASVAAYDLVVVDLPRARPDELERWVARCDVVLVVVTGDVRGATGGRRLLSGLAGSAQPRLVVRRVPHGSLEADELGEWLGVDVVAEVAHDSRLAADLEQGEPPGLRVRSRLARVCSEMVPVLLAGS
jgi:secretion/DNA translocation related CpaE-like protein